MFRRFIAKGGWLALVILAVAAGFGSVAFQQRNLAAALDDHGQFAPDRLVVNAGHGGRERRDPGCGTASRLIA